MTDATGNCGFLLVMMQPPPAMEEEFNAWYDTEHVPERRAVPGFLTGERFVALDGHPRYLALYDLDDPAVLDSPAYRAVAGENFSPWTRRVTGRVLVDRRAGRQLWPGRAITGRHARLRLIRFAGIDDPGALVDALRAALPGQAEGALRVLADDRPGCHFALVGQIDPMPLTDLVARLGPLGRRIDLHLLYAPYDPRP
ncbi:MAG: hypothetical protein KJZ85_05780 [Rhodobacteraceae bacterium]|jgi:hypothetical protein|nr:hypothetical protein [Paracoccaceae bacterium]